jgi:hypothetical protein
MDTEKATFDPTIRAAVAGRSGLFKGEQSYLHVGQCLVVGRSRTCDFSVAKAAECLRLTKEALEQHSSYRRISRKHFRLCLLSADILEVEDLSTNGTVVNGHLVHRVQITGFTSQAKTVMVEFGDGETIVVEPASGRATSPSERRTELRDLRDFSVLRHDTQIEDVEVTPVP